MFTKKAIIFILINTLLLGGFPDFRSPVQDYRVPESFLLRQVPYTGSLSDLQPQASIPTPDELFATPTPLPTSTPAPSPTPEPTPTPKPTATPKPVPTRVPLGDTQAVTSGALSFSFPEPAPLNTDTSTYTLLVNKEYPLSSTYIPYMVEPDVEIYHKGINERRYMQPVAATALKDLFDAAEADGLHLVLRCGFRSYRLQYSVYSWNLKTYGYYEATRYHALAGTSEHQTGLAVDLCCEETNYENNFDFLKTKEYAWLLENAHLYGWILRYPEDKTDITGYNFEPWHFRYVGIELATYLKEQNLVLEEYYGALPTTNLIAVPEEYWQFLSPEDYALMMQDIADYEKKQAEASGEPTPTPEPEIPSEPEDLIYPTPDITPEPEITPEGSSYETIP